MADQNVAFVAHSGDREVSFVTDQSGRRFGVECNAFNPRDAIDAAILAAQQQKVKP